MKVKKILLTLGIIGLGIINSSYGRYDEVGPRFGNAIIGTEFTNIHEQYLDLYVDKDINFKSKKGATEKDIFAVYAYAGNNGSTAYWFYWNTRGELSAYARDRNMLAPRGGKLTNYYVCDDFELPFTGFTGCIEYLYTGADIGVVNNYLSYVNNGDDIIYGQATEGSTISNGRFTPFIAFNIPNKNKAIVFYFKPGRGVTVGYNLPYNYYEDYGIDNEYSVKYHIEEFPDSLIGESPIIGGNSESTTGNIETTTGQKFCPLIQLDITMYGNKYKSSLCRSDQTSGGTYINMFTAYPTRQDFLNSYNTYKQYCHSNSPRYDRQECIDNLQALPYGKAGATITRNAIQSDLPLKKIYEYCRLQTQFTEEQKRGSGRCEFTNQEYYAPGLLSGATTEEEKNQLIQEAGANTIEGMTDGLLTFGEGDFITPEDGSIFDEILPNGIISWKNLVNINFVGNLTSIIAKILVLFKTRPIVDGILPPVILSLLLLIVLFKMYKK